MKGGKHAESRGGATIGDTLSAAMKERMTRLRDELEQKAKVAINTQLQQPPAPWTKRNAPPVQPAIKSKPPAIVPKSKIDHRGPRSGLSVRRGPPRAASKPTQSDTSSKDEFLFWELPPEASVRQSPPNSISDQERHRFEYIVAMGSREAKSSTGEQLFVVMGLDLGTSSTKVVVRFPYEPNSPAVAIPAPIHCRCEDNPYLWQTVVWVREDGQFTAWPESGACLLYSLKQGMMGGRADTLIGQQSGAQFAITRVDAATGFLACVIRYVRGWLLINRAPLFRGREPVWFVNVGLPTESFDDWLLLSSYRRSASAALLMANYGGPLSVSAAQRFLCDDNVKNCAESKDVARRLGIAVIPETAAEATGFVKSTRSAPGLYAMVDVGAMTLDVCTFRFWKPTPDQYHYSLYRARVRPLGVEAFHWFMKEGRAETDFSYQCDRCLWDVIWRTKTKRAPNDECWTRGNDLPIFLVGGGSRNELHRERVRELDPWLKKHAQNEGVRVVELPIPTNIDLPEPIQDFNRLAVAWGLSYPPTEIGEFETPSNIPDAPPPEQDDWQSRFISKDQV